MNRKRQKRIQAEGRAYPKTLQQEGAKETKECQVDGMQKGRISVRRDGEEM